MCAVARDSGTKLDQYTVTISTQVSVQATLWTSRKRYKIQNISPAEVHVHITALGEYKGMRLIPKSTRLIVGVVNF